LSLTITTWNVNSVRLRLDGLDRLHREIRPDILCLQETKVVNDQFPLEPFEGFGYRYHVLHGQPGYHGVAVFSKRPFEQVETHGWCSKEDCRHLRVTFAGELELHNLYVPAGGDLPDRALNDKFAHKLDFLAELTDWFRARSTGQGPAVLVGDLNVAPLETDVWSHKQLQKVVSHTPIEVEALARLQASAGWIDAVRHFVPPEERLYSWWSYRARDWAATDRGRRLDHIWVTAPLLGALRAASVLRPARGWTMPSDHVPVTLELAE
jgi:exodeoxyribonuclease-3